MGGSLVKVYYDNNTYTITKGAETNGTFTVSKSSAKVNDVITLSATPDDGYALSGWTVTDSESNPVTVEGNSFKMPAGNVTVQATFVLAASSKTITISPAANGTVTTSPAGTAYPGETVTITATPDSGYILYSLEAKDEDDGDVEIMENSFTMPSKNVTVSAVFKQGYILSAVKSGNNAYATYYDITQNSISWKVPGNQSFDGYWQIGGLKKAKGTDPSVTDTRYIYNFGENTLSFNVSSIILSTNGVDNNNLTVNSISITAHSSAEDAASGDNPAVTFTTEDNLSFTANTDKVLTYTKNGDADCSSKFLRIAITMTNTTTSNHGIKIKSITMVEP
ncbi:MAG: hypothetical protein IJU68_06460 [Bacteroidales bacterium]|nr:hypothetical protein [Bacteroidales bacterium]